MDIITHKIRSTQSVKIRPQILIPAFGDNQLVCKCEHRQFIVAVKTVGKTEYGSGTKLNAFITELVCPNCKMVMRVSPEGVIERLGTVEREPVQFFK